MIFTKASCKLKGNPEPGVVFNSIHCTTLLRADSDITLEVSSWTQFLFWLVT